ncbi:MAG: hypothetical protein JWM64_2875 [Frankiales bacterium]|nr:hypothetical protein [Frankiales bacterium]
MTSSPWRTSLVLVVSAVSAPAAALTALVAYVVFSGCFAGSCDDADRLGGSLLWLLVAVTLATGPALGWLLLRAPGLARAVAALALGAAATVVGVWVF